MIRPALAIALSNESRPASAVVLPAAGTAPDGELERLGDEIAELAAHLDAGTYRLLELIGEFNAREGWRAGFRTCAHWLSWRTGIDLGAAREKVRVARALKHLPLLSEVMRLGELSYSKARALTRVAIPENEEELMGFAQHATASHVETLVRTWRRVDRMEEQHGERGRHRSRFLTVRPDVDGMFVLRGRLDPEVGALLTRALEVAGEQLYRRAGSDDPVAEDLSCEKTTAGQRRADAIGLLAECTLRRGLAEARVAGRGDSESGDDECGDDECGDEPSTATVSRADRFQVVLHVGTGALAESETLAAGSVASSVDHFLDGSVAFEPALVDGVRVSAETSKRLACDAGWVVMTHGTVGTALNVGRKTRTVPSAIRRALDHRDRGCRFPGCGLRFCDAHHIEHWADGGETRLDNLVLLCRLHHRAVHEEGFRVALADDGRVHFGWPDGRAFPDAPPASPVPTLRGDPVTALEREHQRSGLEIDPWTATPSWDGESFDLGLAIDMFRGLSLQGGDTCLAGRPGVVDPGGAPVILAPRQSRTTSTPRPCPSTASSHWNDTSSKRNGAVQRLPEPSATSSTDSPWPQKSSRER